MANVELGEMAFDHDSLQTVLQMLDRITGSEYKDFEIVVNQGQNYLKIDGRCRNCKIKLRTEENYNIPGWADRIVNGFIETSENHTRTKHMSLLLTTQRPGMAIHCDICMREAGTDAIECSGPEGASIWVCTKCQEDADRYSKSVSVGYTGAPNIQL